MTILEIYEKYKIMPQLQEHQLRVASVAKTICDHLLVPVHTDHVVSVCLLHDMGNILKFDLQKFPQFGEKVLGDKTNSCLAMNNSFV